MHSPEEKKKELEEHLKEDVKQISVPEPRSFSDGMVANPLRSGKFRNKPCLCGSGSKVKSCCGIPVKVPVNLGMFHYHVLRRDQAKAEFFAKAWEEDIAAANKLLEENEKHTGNQA